MQELSLLYIALVYLAAINVVAFFKVESKEIQVAYFRGYATVDGCLWRKHRSVARDESVAP